MVFCVLVVGRAIQSSPVSESQCSYESIMTITLSIVFNVSNCNFDYSSIKGYVDQVNGIRIY